MRKHQDNEVTDEWAHVLEYIYNGEYHNVDFEIFCRMEDKKGGKGKERGRIKERKGKILLTRGKKKRNKRKGIKCKRRKRV
jgi:predicted nucleotidyltransferase